MQVSSFHLHLSSDIPGRLMAFYRDTIGLPPAAGMEDFAVVLGPATTIGFGGHSETHGRTKEPSRVLITLFIEDINASQAELEAKGV